jgi:hypothetical protein
MAHLFGTGFEMGTIPGMTLVSTNHQVSSEVKRSGNYSYLPNALTRGAVRSLGMPKRFLFIAVSVYPGSLPVSDGSLVSILTPANCILYTLGIVSGTRSLALWRQGTFDESSAIVKVADGSALPENAWTCLELSIAMSKLEIWNGSIRVKVNGQPDIEVTAEPPPYYATSEEAITRVSLNHTGASSGGVINGVGSGWHYDDFTINDDAGDRNNSYPGRGGYWPVTVSGPGDLAEFTPSEGVNYACVDDVPPDVETHVSSDTEGHRDSYAVSVPEVPGGVTTFTLWHYARLLDAGAGNLTPFIRRLGTNYDGELKGLDEEYRHVSHVWETNPATGEPWTLGDLAEFYVGQRTS